MRKRDRHQERVEGINARIRAAQRPKSMKANVVIHHDRPHGDHAPARRRPPAPGAARIPA